MITIDVRTLFLHRFLSFDIGNWGSSMIDIDYYWLLSIISLSINYVWRAVWCRNITFLAWNRVLVSGNMPLLFIQPKFSRSTPTGLWFKVQTKQKIYKWCLFKLFNKELLIASSNITLFIPSILKYLYGFFNFNHAPNNKALHKQ